MNVQQPKWQRARFVRVDDYPEIVGREVWAESATVEEVRVDRFDNNGRFIGIGSKRRGIEINVTLADGTPLAPPLEALELLPRFTFVASIVTLSRFLAGQEA